MNRAAALAFDVGGSKVLAAVVDPDGHVSCPLRRPTPRTGGIDLLTLLIELGRTVQAQAEAKGIVLAACGVATAGIVYDNQIVSANDLLPGWAGQPLEAAFHDALKLPTRLYNDVQAAALAEARLGAARGARDALVVAVGTGIGGALITDGQLALGRSGIAGSIGHIPVPSERHRACPCGATDHLEGLAGGRAIEAIYEEDRGEAANVRTIAELAAVGDLHARAILDTAATLVGRAIGGAANLLDPDLVVLGGGVPEIGQYYFDAVRAGMTLEEMRPNGMPPLVSAALRTNAALVGAALAVQGIEGDIPG